MATTFHLTVASVGENKFDGQAISATFPGVAGEFTVLAHHEPLVSTLKDGSVRIKAADGSETAVEIRTGVVEISGNRAVVLI